MGTDALEASADVSRDRNRSAHCALHPVTPRRQLPVHSPISLAALNGAAAAATTGRTTSLRAVASQLRKQYATPRVVLTDSGTSALVMAFRLAVGEGKVVAIPGYACVDVVAAARFADVRVRVYDIEPETLSPNLESLERTLNRGAHAVLVAHLYGYPSDMDAVLALAERFGIPVIEDAAQAAGATYQGRPLGAFGALSVLSFGRGKGVTGGGGGALLINDSRFDEPLESALSQIGRPSRGVPNLLVATALWALGRPSLYGIPSRIPMLRLGETVYRAAHEPQSISAFSAALVARGLQAAPREINTRSRVAALLSNAVEE
ncbi:MAG: DegT/DnrJ/EryC1/StrS family aminotransferase, partial [Pseudomonadota bacterium]